MCGGGCTDDNGNGLCDQHEGCGMAWPSITIQKPCSTTGHVSLALIQAALPTSMAMAR